MGSSETRGPLCNGNPRGDPHASPRCGAQTRAGEGCRQPAMATGVDGATFSQIEAARLEDWLTRLGEEPRGSMAAIHFALVAKTVDAAGLARQSPATSGANRDQVFSARRTCGEHGAHGVEAAGFDGRSYTTSRWRPSARRGTLKFSFRRKHNAFSVSTVLSARPPC
jgi:hypothetical protein